MRQTDLLQGATARVIAQFQDPDTGAPTTPVEPVTLRRRRPNGTGGYTDPGDVVMTPIVIAAGDPSFEAGPAYRATFTADQPGTWLLLAVSSGIEPMFIDGDLDVRAAPFT